jgi:DNA (cytosine-5)-methyltransferase 1
MADTDGERLEGAESVGIRHRQLAQHSNAGRPTASWWAVEPAVGRVADGVPRRVDRLRTLGNAVVPQVAELIGRAIIAEAAP